MFVAGDLTKRWERTPRDPGHSDPLLDLLDLDLTNGFVHAKDQLLDRDRNPEATT
jgi:hypothetical protein